jgi:AcrR family transcriptional regulator
MSKPEPSAHDPRPRLSEFYRKYFRKEPQQARSRSVVEAILFAGIESMKRGAHHFTLSNIASRAGVGIGSLYDYFSDENSLVASVVAKLTEDNLAAFEEIVAETKDAPLRDTMAGLIDRAFDLYVKDTRLPRAVLRAAHTLNLMPMLAEGQTLFAGQLATALSVRTGKPPSEWLRLATYVATHAMMGQMLALIWEIEAPFPREAVRAACIDLVTNHVAAALQEDTESSQ